MTFNPDAKIDPSKTSRRGGRTGAMVGGGSAVVVIGLFLLSQLLGVDLTGLAGGGGGAPQPGNDEPLSQCTTGEAANESIDCRMAAAADSLDTYWSTTLPQMGVDYTSTEVVLFAGQVGTGCGGASSAVGPFYCPGDERVYIDATFFDTLTSQFGADDGALAQEYVIAHEYGHHVENILGVLGQGQDGRAGPESGGVRVELMADCFAGVWAHNATRTTDASGTPFLKPLTEEDISSALSAAAAVGDDHIQQATQGQVTPHTWTHGSSAQRQKWFIVGYESGQSGACDTFNTNDL